MDEMTPNEMNDNVTNTNEVNTLDVKNTTNTNVNEVVEMVDVAEDVPNPDISTMEEISDGEGCSPTESSTNTQMYSTSKKDMAITDDDFKWYCLKTYNSYEDRVKKTLEAEVKRLGLGYCIREVVIPLETVFEVRNGKKKTKLRNFLAGYVLVNAAINDQKKTKKKIIDLVTDISGVVAFVGRKNDPAALQPLEVERIFSRINERSEVATIDTIYRKGDPVAVLEGPFTGFKGTIIEVTNEKQKVKVEITILGRKTPIELNFEQVQFDKPA